jgi:sec-independent protein translocase protein TatB
VFNIGPGELALILVAALIVLGPKRLPELARTLGKFMREFRRQTDDVRNLVEREFYQMDQALDQPIEQIGAGTQKPAIPSGGPPAVPVPAMTDPGHDEFGRLLAPPSPMTEAAPAAATAPAEPPPATPENGAAPPAKPPNGEAPADLKPGGQ